MRPFLITMLAACLLTLPVSAEEMIIIPKDVPHLEKYAGVPVEVVAELIADELDAAKKSIQEIGRRLDAHSRAASEIGMYLSTLSDTGQDTTVAAALLAQTSALTAADLAAHAEAEAIAEELRRAYTRAMAIQTVGKLILEPDSPDPIRSLDTPA